MLTRETFTRILSTQPALIIDGALATELEDRGFPPDATLWSAKFLLDEHSKRGLINLHEDYFAAGANIAITCSYQASTQGLCENLNVTEHTAQALIRESVRLAQQAREVAYITHRIPRTRPLLIAGSVGPYGAYLADGSEYRGDYTRSISELQDFHRPRIQALIDAGVDLLALETMPSLVEIRALLGLLRTEFPKAIAWVSCSMRDVGHLSDGTAWEEVVSDVLGYKGQIVALGVNCVPLAEVTETLRGFARLTDLPLVCYPNSGEVWDAQSRTWKEDGEASSAPPVRQWLAEGARLIGGCCRTGPAFVQTIRDEFGKL